MLCFSAANFVAVDLSLGAFFWLDELSSSLRSMLVWFGALTIPFGIMFLCFDADTEPFQYPIGKTDSDCYLIKTVVQWYFSGGSGVEPLC